MRPDEPCYAGSLSYGDEDTDGICVKYGHGGRVQMQRYVASHYGCQFNEVSVLRRYARIFTRQEMWDSQGRDLMRDARAMELGIGWYFDFSQSLRPGSPSGYYYDGIDPDDGYIRPVLPCHAIELETIDAIKDVPETWSIPPDAEWPVWEFVDRLDPRGFPILIAEMY